MPPADQEPDSTSPPGPVLSPVLGLDVGDRRIGIAISDPLRITAQPLNTLTRTSRRNDLRYFSHLLRLRPFDQIVVGLPLYPSGDPSPQAAKVQTFAAQLGDHLKLPIHLWDERLSTSEAHRYLDATGRPGTTRRQVIDQISAVLILENWLAAHPFTQPSGNK
jgi:putative Holliday junction resolvase